MNRKKLEYNKVKVVIFDCDGVLFDSREANAAYYNAILKHFDKPVLNSDDLEVVHMSTVEESIKHLFRGDNRLSEVQEYRLHQADYSQFLRLMIMEPHLIEVLKSLKKRYRLAIATNRTTTIHPILDVFELDHYFDLVVSSLDVNKPKPHPETAFKILDHFHINSDEALYVGDSIIDYEVTKKANIFFVSYKHTQLEADFHTDDLRELLPLLSC